MQSIHFAQAGLAFLEGVGLILSPCILPILPIVLAASFDGGRARPLGIITGFIASFTVFALLARHLLGLLNLDPDIVRNVSLALLMIFGVTLFSQYLSDTMGRFTHGLANLGKRLTSRYDRKTGFLSGVAIGALIGLIWAPCAGPVMAVAVVQIIQAKTSLDVLLTVVMFALGVGVPMLLIAIAGRQIMAQLGFLKRNSHVVRRVLGVIIVTAAVMIYTGADVQLLAATGDNSSKVQENNGVVNALANPYPAPEIVGITGWVNSRPLMMENLRGKVVLVDFWTYSCINCVRTLPYITRWYNQYRDKGFVVLGIHSPEFEFEKKMSNVEMAVDKFGIRYPVALDNKLATWSNFKNQYWPAHYLIDQNGKVVYTHFGEGEYDVTEHNIRALLGMRAGEMSMDIADGSIPSLMQTPETYLGYERAEGFANPERASMDVDAHYRMPEKLRLNSWGLSGDWRIEGQRIVATSSPKDHSLNIHFFARKVFLVLGTVKNKPVTVDILLNGAPIGTAGGRDVRNSRMVVDHEMLYELVNQGDAKTGILEIKTNEPGLQAYAFTFGS